MKKLYFPLLVIILLCALTACASTDTRIATTSSQKQTSDYISPERASSYVGEYITVRMRRAYCDYRPDVEGKPTFCNDKPYPNHNFTLVIWESNYESLDGECLLVTGEVSMYQGKPQIIKESVGGVSGVTECP